MTANAEARDTDTEDPVAALLATIPDARNLIEPIRIRVDAELRDELNNLEAALRRRGYRVCRSDLVRAALAQFTQNAAAAIPEIAKVTLPHERAA